MNLKCPKTTAASIDEEEGNTTHFTPSPSLKKNLKTVNEALVQNYDVVLMPTTYKGLEVAAVGKKSSALLHARGEPLEEPIELLECELVSEITGPIERGSVEKRGQSQYEISYQPTIKGRHQLHIKVKGQHIRESPFDDVVVTSPVEKLGTQILAIGRVMCPWDVAINQRGEVVVTKINIISVFTPSGKRLQSFGSHGSGPGQFDNYRMAQTTKWLPAILDYKNVMSNISTCMA